MESAADLAVITVRVAASVADTTAPAVRLVASDLEAESSTVRESVAERPMTPTAASPTATVSAAVRVLVVPLVTAASETVTVDPDVRARALVLVAASLTDTVSLAVRALLTAGLKAARAPDHSRAVPAVPLYTRPLPPLPVSIFHAVFC